MVEIALVPPEPDIPPDTGVPDSYWLHGTYGVEKFADHQWQRVARTDDYDVAKTIAGGLRNRRVETRITQSINREWT